MSQIAEYLQSQQIIEKQHQDEKDEQLNNRLLGLDIQSQHTIQGDHSIINTNDQREIKTQENNAINNQSKQINISINQKNEAETENPVQQQYHQFEQSLNSNQSREIVAKDQSSNQESSSKFKRLADQLQNNHNYQNQLGDQVNYSQYHQDSQQQFNPSDIIQIYSVEENRTVNKRERKKYNENNKQQEYLFNEVQEIEMVRTLDNKYNWIIQNNNQRIDKRYLLSILLYLEKLQYYDFNYINSGGEADIISGKKLNQGQVEEYAFRILEVNTDEYDNLKNEFDIIKQLKNPINIIKFYDSYLFKIANTNHQFAIFIFEKCQFCLIQEMKILTQEEKNYSFEELCKLIFDLIDGLNELKHYQIIHLDIKLSNVLKNSKGDYVYSDFGMASKNIKGQVKIRGLTQGYSAPEQNQFSNNITYNTDIYQLGKTFLKILSFFQKQNQNLTQKSKQQQKNMNQSQGSVDDHTHDDIINRLIEFINKRMLVELLEQREECQHILRYIYSIIGKHSRKFQKYYHSKIEFCNLIEFDTSKEFKFLPYKIEGYLQLQFQILVDLNKSKLVVNDELFQESKKLKINQKINKFILFIDLIFSKQKQQYENKNYKNVIRISILLTTLINNKIIGEKEQEINKLKKYYSHLIELQAKSYYQLNKYEKALILFLQSYEQRKLIYPEEHPIIADTLLKIGSCYEELFQTSQSQDYYIKSILISMKLFKGYHSKIATCLNNFGKNYLFFGNMELKKSLDYQLKALTIRECIFEGHHYEIADSLDVIGSCYEYQNDSKKAEYCFQRSLDIKNKLYIGNHPHLANSLNNLGACYENLNKIQEGLELQKRALEMKTYLFTKDHPYVANSLNNIGCIYLSLGELDKAFESFNQSLQIRENFFQGDHHNIAESLNNLGSYYEKKGEYDKAIDHYTRSYNMRQNLFPGNHVVKVLTLEGLARSYEFLKLNEKAKEYFNKSLLMKYQIYPDGKIPDQLKVGRCFESLKNTARDSKIYSKALKKKSY